MISGCLVNFNELRRQCVGNYNSKIFCEANTSARVKPILSNVNLIVKFSFNRDDGIVVVPEL